MDLNRLFSVEFESIATTSPYFADLRTVVVERPELVNETTIELPFVPAPLPSKEEPGVNESADESRLNAFPPEVRKVFEEHHRD